MGAPKREYNDEDPVWEIKKKKKKIGEPRGLQHPPILEQNAPGNQLAQKDSLQFITPAGPRQSTLYSQGPRPAFVKISCTLSVRRAQAHTGRFLKPSLEHVKMLKGDAMTHNQKGQLLLHWNRHQWMLLRLHKGDWPIGDCYSPSGGGKSWYGIWCLSVREGCLAVGAWSPWLPGTSSKIHWEC